MIASGHSLNYCNAGTRARAHTHTYTHTHTHTHTNTHTHTVCMPSHSANKRTTIFAIGQAPRHTVFGLVHRPQGNAQQCPNTPLFPSTPCPPTKKPLDERPTQGEAFGRPRRCFGSQRRKRKVRVRQGSAAPPRRPHRLLLDAPHAAGRRGRVCWHARIYQADLYGRHHRQAAPLIADCLDPPFPWHPVLLPVLAA